MQLAIQCLGALEAGFSVVDLVQSKEIAYELTVLTGHVEGKVVLERCTESALDEGEDIAHVLVGVLTLYAEMTGRQAGNPCRCSAAARLVRRCVRTEENLSVFHCCNATMLGGHGGRVVSS